MHSTRNSGWCCRSSWSWCFFFASCSWIENHFPGTPQKRTLGSPEQRQMRYDWTSGEVCQLLKWANYRFLDWALHVVYSVVVATAICHRPATDSCIAFYAYDALSSYSYHHTLRNSCILYTSTTLHTSTKNSCTCCTLAYILKAGSACFSLPDVSLSVKRRCTTCPDSCDEQ